MLLCDVGNTSYHFLSDERSHKERAVSFDPSTVKEKLFYVCVNPKVKEVLKSLENWIDLSDFVDGKNYYETMGVDRIFACEAVFDGVIIDAGSAITVDVVINGTFEGGFIYPGVNAMRQTYKNVSSALDYSFNFECDLDIMPKNSRDAISYGFLKTLQREALSYKMDVVLTGGDADKLSKIFPKAKIEESLIFDGMKKIIKKADLC